MASLSSCPSCETWQKPCSLVAQQVHQSDVHARIVCGQQPVGPLLEGLVFAPPSFLFTCDLSITSQQEALMSAVTTPDAEDRRACCHARVGRDLRPGWEGAAALVSVTVSRCAYVGPTVSRIRKITEVKIC